jgi:hypothetical protein
VSARAPSAAISVVRISASMFPSGPFRPSVMSCRRGCRSCEPAHRRHQIRYFVMLITPSARCVSVAHASAECVRVRRSVERTPKSPDAVVAAPGMGAAARHKLDVALIDHRGIVHAPGGNVELDGTRSTVGVPSHGNSWAQSATGRRRCPHRAEVWRPVASLPRGSRRLPGASGSRRGSDFGRGGAAGAGFASSSARPRLQGSQYSP